MATSVLRGVVLSLRRRVDVGIGAQGLVLARGDATQRALAWADIYEIDVRVHWSRRIGRQSARARQVLRFSPALPGFGGRTDLDVFRLHAQDAEGRFTHGVVLDYPTALDYGIIPGIAGLAKLLLAYAGPKYTGVVVTGGPGTASGAG